MKKMKKRKLASVILSAVIMVTALGNVCYADDEEAEDTESTARATVCFDNTEVTNTYIHTFGDTALSGLTYSGISGKDAYQDGSLLISENFTDAPSEDVNTGIYFSASDFGMESFAGCTATLEVYAESSGADALEIYSDGDIYLSENVNITANPVWLDVTVSVPEDIDNTNLGVLITSSNMISGSICRIDNLNIYDANGTLVENIGDYMEISTEKSTANKVIMIIVFIILIVAVVGVCGYFIKKFVIGRYR